MLLLPTSSLNFLFLLLLVTLSNLRYAQASDGSDAMKKLCSSLSRATQCKASFKIPTFKVRNGKTDWFKYNPCKTTFKFLGGKQCIPGTDKVVVTVPIGIDVGFKSVDGCALARKAIPGMEQIAQKSGAICTCLPEMLSIVDGDTFKALVQNGDAGTASAEVLEKFGGFAQCAIDAGMSIKDNSAGLSQGSGSLVTSPNVRVLKAAEMDLARYVAFAGAVVPCATGAGCDAVRGFFTNYLQDSEELMAGQIKDLLIPWSNGMNQVQKNFDAIANSTDSLGIQGSQIGVEVKSIIDSFCPDAATCLNNSFSEFKKQVETTLDISKEIAALNGIIAQTQREAQQATQTITDAVKLFGDVSDLGIDSIITLVQGGELNSIGQLAGSLKAAQQLPRVIDTLQDNLAKLPELIGEIARRGPAFIDSLQALFVRNWIQDYAGDEASADKIGEGIFNAQKLLAHMIPQATQLWSSAEWLTESVGIVVGGERVGLDVQVASYQRWTKGWFDMPCLTTGKITFSIAGFSKTVGYPKFYRCRQNYMVPFPNHHIPFIRIRLPADSNLGRLGGASADVKTTSISWNEEQSKPTLTTSTVASSATSSTSSSTESTTLETTLSSSTESTTPETTLSSSTAVATPTTSLMSEPTTSSVTLDGSTSTPLPGPSETPTALPVDTALSTTEVVVETGLSAPTAAPTVKRSTPWSRRQESGDDEGPPLDPNIYSVPDDIQTSITIDAASAGLYTASEAALAATSAASAPQPNFSGTPTATEIAPDPAETTLAVLEGFDPYNDLPEKVGEEEDLSDWEEVGAITLNNATPTLNDGQASVTVSVRSTAVSVKLTTTLATATNRPNPTGSTGRAESLQRMNAARLLGASIAVLVCFEVL